MAVYALDTILLGHAGAIERGDEVPATFLNDLGEDEDTDFARLEELELVSDQASVDDDVEAPDAASTESTIPANATKAELVAIAAERSVEVPAKATKAQLVELLAA